jgi:hypothetical protein
MQRQKGSLATFVAVVIVSIAVGLIWVHVSNRPPGAQVITAVKQNTKPVLNECMGNGTGKLILVSVTNQHMWACQGTNVVSQSAVTTGASEAPNGVDNATPTGTWHIYEKFRNLDLKGSDANGPWDDYVQYWMPFDSAVGFHDASWQTFPFGSSKYKTNGSHGCVQLPTQYAAWLYGWAPVGTTVTVST